MHLYFFPFKNKKKALNNNEKELEANRKSISEPGDTQERSSVLVVFKKVNDVSSVGLVYTKWFEHHICSSQLVNTN